MTAPTLRSIALAALAVSGCADDEGAADTPSTAPDALVGVPLDQVQYTLDFDLAGVEPLEEGGFRVETSAGYTVVIGSGELASHSASLTACPQVASKNSPPLPIAALDLLLGARTAWATHGTTASRSTLHVDVHEDLGELAPMAFEPIVFDPTTWCHLHYLIGADDTTFDRALVLEGTWRGPSDAEPTPFTVQTGLGNALLRPIAEDIVEGEGQAARVRITRAPGMWFDGIDFATASTDNLTRTVLINVIVGTRVEVRLSADPTP